MDAPTNYLDKYIEWPDGPFVYLWGNLPWIKHDDAPRRECWMNDYGLDYTYGQGAGERTYTPSPWNKYIDSVRNKLNVDYNTTFDCCFVNGYEHSRHALGWHADDSPEMDHDHPIAVVSFGAARNIMFRPKDRSTSPETVMLDTGSLLMMLPGMQRDWEHKIPKASSEKCGPRLSLTFRKLVL